MELKELQKHWNAYGEIDPLWAIVSLPDKRHGKWDVQEFFALGKQEIARVIKYVESLKFSLPRKRALDFGCGVGRLTQALGDYFQECHGVDIAPAMVRQARQYNRHGARCEYHLNEKDDLSLFQDNSFSLVYSNIVLQHMKPEYSKNYIKEFLRILAPGGLAYFQLPAEQEKHAALDPTMAIEAMPEAAFQADIRPIDPPLVLKPGVWSTLTARVKNTSSVTWPSQKGAIIPYWVGLGAAWIDEAGNPVRFEQGAVLPRPIAPGESVDLTLNILAPRTLGVHRLELDMVQDNVGWFRHRGSPPATVDIKVRDLIHKLSDIYRKVVPGRKAQAAQTTEEFTPIIQMYHIEKDEAIAFIQEHGGTIVDVQQDPGQNFASYYYAVTKK